MTICDEWNEGGRGGEERRAMNVKHNTTGRGWGVSEVRGGRENEQGRQRREERMDVGGGEERREDV